MVAQVPVMCGVSVGSLSGLAMEEMRCDLKEFASREVKEVYI